MLAYIMYVTTLLVTVKRIIEFTEQFQKGMTGIERFHEIMSTKPDIVDKPNAIELDKARGHIEFRRSEEHTSELQSRQYLVCRLLLEKKTGQVSSGMLQELNSSY